MKPRAHAISAQEFGESGQHRIPPKCVTPSNQESGIRNRESGIGNRNPGQNVGIRNQESGIRNQESGIRIPVKMLAIQQLRNQNRKRDRRIGRGEQNQELALAALENRKGSGGNENGPRWESLGRESEYLSRRGT